MLPSPMYYYGIVSIIVCLVILLKSEGNRRKSTKALEEAKDRQKTVERTQYYHCGSNLPTMALLTKKLAKLNSDSATYHVSLIKLGRTNPLFRSIEECVDPMQDLVRRINKRFNPFALAVHDNEYLIMAFVSQTEMNQSEAKNLQKKIMGNLPKSVDFFGTPVPIDYAISSLSLTSRSSIFGIEKVERRLSFDMQKALSRVDGIFYHNEKLYKQEMFNKHIAKEIETSLSRGGKDFSVVLQPIYEATSTDTPYSFESLIRWKNKANVGPGVFIPVISQIPHLHYRITKLMISRVISVFQKMEERGIKLVPISINISSEDLATEGFAKMVEEQFSSHRQFMPYVIFEVIETEKLALSQTVKANMDELINEGISFAIDDFGSGYANFELLKNPYIKYLKIDKQYAKSILDQKSNDNLLLDCMIDLCHKVGRKVVVEGIEEYQQYKYLQDYSPVFLQGYYFCAPVKPIEALKMCSKT
ncbi:EAL domain-containing protein [Vibrio sp. HN007]|uniref:EAL domain-containing protein n=1 Tax=Vibrio iocasae TaxID=3098914 RepID=UPI0035D437A9